MTTKMKLKRYRIDEELAVRSFIIPNQQQNSQAFLGFVLEQLTQIQIATAGQWLSGLSDQLDLVINGPTHNVHQMMSLQN